MSIPPWVIVEAPSDPSSDLDWTWYCECSAYDIEPTQVQVVFAAINHGTFCKKGEFRYRRDGGL